GTIPEEIGTLKNLTHIVLSQNQLSGTIPKGIENLSMLQYLVLSHNKLSGELPALHKLPSLIIVSVNDNMLSGTIPFNGSFNWNYLRILSIENNNFNGRLPKLPNQMNTTFIFTLHRNQFSDHNLHEWLIYINIYIYIFFLIIKIRYIYMYIKRLTELISKTSILQILSIYGNQQLTGQLPKYLYNSSVTMLLAHDCGINGLLPWSDIQGNIAFSTLLKNRLSGPMPNGLLQAGDFSTRNNIIVDFTDSELRLSFNVSMKLKNGLYLSGNRFSQGKTWYKVYEDQSLPDYVSSDERNAKNLYVANSSVFVEMMLIGAVIVTTLILFLRQFKKISFIKQRCGDRRFCGSMRAKLPIHPGFKQMKVLLRLLNNWLETIIIITLVIIYVLHATYYEKGYPLSHVSLAYFENSSLSITIILVLIILLSNGIILIYTFRWIIQSSFLTTNIIDNTSLNYKLHPFTCQKGMMFIITFLEWCLAITCVIMYFAFESFPDNNTLHISSSLLYFIQIIMSLVLSIHNSFISPNLAFYIIEFIVYFAGIKNRILVRKARGYLALLLRTLVCIPIPLILALYFYNNCGGKWIHYWDTCNQQNMEETILTYRWHYNQSIEWFIDENDVVLDWGDLCKVPTFQPSGCIREILEKWGNVMVVKMVINIFTPWIPVLLNDLISRIQCQSCPLISGPPTKLNFQTVSLFANVELVILVGLFCPLIVPLCAMVIISNILKFQYLLNKNKTNKQHDLLAVHLLNNDKDNNILYYKLSKETPAFPLSMLVGPFVFQQVIWVLSAAFGDEMYYNPHAVMIFFCVGFIAIDICFILAIIISQYSFCNFNRENKKNLFVDKYILFFFVNLFIAILLDVFLTHFQTCLNKIQLFFHFFFITCIN
ncbi:hypothetical protein RFI_02633, partial [Reticulomyxa filosa]